QNYLWTNGITNYTVANPVNLSIGVWSITVTDALTNCKINDVFYISQPPALTINLGATSPTACVGNSVTLSSTVSGGTPLGTGSGYTYLWNTGPTTHTQVVSQGISGTTIYTLSAYDSYNCGITKTVS